MLRLRLVPVLVLPFTVACGDRSNPAATKPPAAGSGCPVPVTDGVQARFAVGVIADHRVEDAVGHAAKCHDEFVANPAVTLEPAGSGATRAKVVAPGTFQGHCPGETVMRTFEAVAPVKVVVEVNGTHQELGELGIGKPIILSKDHPDWLVSLIAHPADRCGTPLDVGTSGSNLIKWTLGAGCEQTVKLVPWGADLASSTQMQLAPLGAGTCTLGVEALGVKADVPVTVK